jgi:UDP-hydrolysing UDP-N-acetyl-D-glucosamine 2-epimerase
MSFSMQKRKVCVVLVDRANYGRLKPVMRAIAAHPDLEIQVIAAGTMVLGRFGRPVEIVRRDGFPVSAEVYLEVEGSTPGTMAKSVGMGVLEFAGEFLRLAPDVVLLIGDRYEALAAAVAAAYMNLCIAHIQGGEVSGSIDESARHAISKFAHYHFPSTARSAEYLVRMGEDPETILAVGCPSSDIALSLDRRLPSSVVNATGSGAAIDVDEPFALVVFHPTTTEFGSEAASMNQVLTALGQVRMPTLLLWPNIDAGSDQISKSIRIFRDQEAPDWLRTITNVTPESYLQILARTACAIGNSSSFVRDAGYFGTPVVLVGDRQAGREMDAHVLPSSVDASDIEECIRYQIDHGRYAQSSLYGSGNVSSRIASGLAALHPYSQKRLHYVYEASDEVPGAGNCNGTGRIKRNPAQEHRAPARTSATRLHR